MSELGKKLIDGLKQLQSDLKHNRPIKRTIVRRMKVKGETVFTHETVTAPMRWTTPPPPAASTPDRTPDR